MMCSSKLTISTVLVSILSYTFSTISADAAAEVRVRALFSIRGLRLSSLPRTLDVQMLMQRFCQAMYRRAVYTIEGVKADAIFSYQPPLNLFALAFMLPSSYILTPRWFHKV